MNSLKLLGTILLLLPFSFSCGSDTATPEDLTGSYEGAISFSDGNHGTITIDVPAARLDARQQSGGQSITGQCIITGGATVSLAGSLSATGGTFSLTGGGYTFSGTFANGTFTGSLTLGGSDVGSFSGVDTADGAPTVYCGTFVAEDDSGVFLVIVSGTTVTGSHTGAKDSGTLYGTLSGSTFSVDSSEGGTAGGTISGSSVSGFIYSENDSTQVIGSFEGSTAACNN